MSGAAPTLFTRKVIAAILAIPRGRVATYGQIARIAGRPQGSRGVSWILASSTRKHGLPWFRVIGAAGKISIPAGTRGFAEQKRLLQKEGVDVGVGGEVDLDEFRWHRGAAGNRRKRR